MFEIIRRMETNLINEIGVDNLTVNTPPPEQVINDTNTNIVYIKGKEIDKSSERFHKLYELTKGNIELIIKMY